MDQGKGTQSIVICKKISHIRRSTKYIYDSCVCVRTYVYIHTCIYKHIHTMGKVCLPPDDTRHETLDEKKENYIEPVLTGNHLFL